jgi:hypothetical protein
MAALLQRYVDNAVAVNVHVPAATWALACGDILQQAWTMRLKNCMVLRQAA